MATSADARHTSAAAAASARPKHNAHETCPVCEYNITDSVHRDETYTSRSPHERVNCASCNGVACRLCVQKYLLTLHEEPCCMYCRAQWSLSFVSRVCSVSFATGPLRRHRGRVLYERERAWIPLSMVQAELRRNYKRRSDLGIELERLHLQLAETNALLRDPEIVPRVAEHMQRALAEMRTIAPVQARRQYRNGRDFVVYQPVEQGADDARGREHDTDAGTRRALFTRPCPAPNCRGMLNNAFRCAVCDARVCKSCFEIKSAGNGGADKEPGAERNADEELHVCNPDAVATATALKQSCKPCPNCAALIYKIEGCDQMFCTACNTPFLWSTLAILRTGFIHNPHYFEFLDHMRRQGVENPAAAVMQHQAPPTQDPCSIAARRELLQNLIVQNNAPNSNVINNARTLALEIVVVLQAVALDRQPWGVRRPLRKLGDMLVRHNANTPPHERNADLRLNFISNAISEDQFRSMLSRREAQQERATELLHILTFVADTIVDAMLRNAERQRRLNADKQTETITEVHNIIRYARTQVAAVVARYKRAVDFPDVNFQFSTIIYTPKTNAATAKRKAKPAARSAAAAAAATAAAADDDDDDDDDNDNYVYVDEDEDDSDDNDGGREPVTRRVDAAENTPVNMAVRIAHWVAGFIEANGVGTQNTQRGDDATFLHHADADDDDDDVQRPAQRARK